MTPGSTLWLMKHEMRLTWRFGEDKSRPVRLLLGLAVLALMSLMGVPFGLLLRGHATAPNGLSVVACLIAFGFISVMSFSVALATISASFIDRGDLDLLLSSPLPMRRVLTVRLSAVAIRSVSVWLLLFGPAILITAAMAGPRWLGGLVLLLDAGLAGTSVASWLAIGLFRLIGPRKVKTVTTLVSALSGLSMGMIGPFLGRNFGARQVSGVLPDVSPDSLLGLPAHVVYGDPLAGLVLTAFLLAVFLITTWRLAPTFARISARSEAMRRPSAGRAPLRGFGGGLFRLLLVKDYRLLLRNHALLLQILSRSLAFIPLLVINLSHAGLGARSAQIALAVTLVLGQVSGALVWAFSVAESQPDLLASAPIPPDLAQRSRLTAALMPALIFVLLAAGAVGAQNRLAGIAILVMATGAGLCSAAINVTAKASQVRRSAWGGGVRPAVVATLTDMICSGFWCGGAYLLATGSIWCALPVWLGLSTVWLWREVTRRPT